MTPFWDLGSCSLVKLTDDSEVLTASIIRGWMEASSASEMSVSFYEANYIHGARTRRFITVFIRARHRSLS
jgi:hypothetical protein